MCGICGFVVPGPTAESAQSLEAMNKALTHRGPDASGQVALDGVGLASSRLAIIDLESGDQPICVADQGVAIVLNGEIYNYRELRCQLESKGHRFQTRSDTEVIAVGYLEYGVGIVERLRGMFSFAIHDRRNETVILARDRFGEKPLFYWNGPNGLVFSSELRSLLEWPEVPRRMDREALAYFLRFGYSPWPSSLFDGVNELPPGSVMTYRDGVPKIEEYYRPFYKPDPALADLHAATEAVGAALETAVRRQMVSDVPIGAFLSGGIDSGAVVSTLQRLSDRPVQTFTVRFADDDYDESVVARTVAERLGTDHHEISVGDAEFSSDDLYRIVDHMGQPFVDSSAIPSYLISRAVRPHVKVCLTGDGGDEMFAGYPIFRWAATVDRIAGVPAPLRNGARIVAGAARRMPGLGSSGVVRQAHRALTAAGGRSENRLSAIGSIFLPEELESLVVDPEVRSVSTGSLQLANDLPAEAESWPALRRRMYLLTRQQLPQDMLTKIDRMSMAASLELRAPLLDADLTDLAMTLPENVLISGKVQKLALREAVRPYLPDIVFNQSKSGFSIPLHRFRNEAFREAAHDLLDVPTGPLAVLDPKQVAAVVERGLTRSEDRADITVYRATHQLWALMQLASWSKRFNVTV